MAKKQTLANHSKTGLAHLRCLEWVAGVGRPTGYKVIIPWFRLSLVAILVIANLVVWLLK